MSTYKVQWSRAFHIFYTLYQKIEAESKIQQVQLRVPYNMSRVSPILKNPFEISVWNECGFSKKLNVTIRKLVKQIPSF